MVLQIPPLQYICNYKHMFCIIWRLVETKISHNMLQTSKGVGKGGAVFVNPLTIAQAVSFALTVLDTLGTQL